MTTPFPFVAAQVLTANELNSITNLPSSTKTVSYTLVAGDAGKRIVMNSASSTTITVNTSLFTAGDIVELSNIGVGVSTVTAGTATVSSAGPLAIPQYGGGRLVFTSASAAIYFPSAVTVAAPAAAGLSFISAGTVSAGATISILNAFSTTYDFYSLRFSNFQMANDNVELQVQLGSSGTADTGANYNWRGYYVDGTISAVGNGLSRTFFKINENLGTTKNSLFLELSSPFLSSTTYFTSHAFANYSAGAVGHAFDGMLNTSTSYTDIFFNSNSGNCGPFTYALFGYAKS